MTRFLRWALVLGALFYLLQLRFTIDDAAISFAYARQWAHGHGLGVLVTGGPRVEGYSDFLWVALLAGGVKLGVSAVTTAKVLGLLFVLGTTVLVHHLVRPLLRRRESMWVLLALPVSFSWAFWAASGLENALYGFLLTLAAALLVADDLAATPRVGVASAFAVVAICLTRPDGIAYAAAGAVLKLVTAVWPERRPDRLARAVAWCGVVAVVFGGYLLWHYSFYATLLPNTTYAKLGQPGVAGAAKGITDPSSSGWAYIGGWLWHHGGLLLVPTLVAGAAATLRRPERVIAVFGATTLLLPLYQADWMVHYRFLSYAAPFAVALAAIGVDRALPHRVAWVRAFAVATVALYALVNVGLGYRINRRGYQDYVSMDEVEAFYSSLKADGDRIGTRDPQYFLGDLGATTYRLDLRVLDAIGLGDYHIAHANWDRRVLEQYLFVEQRPAFISTHDKWTSKYHLTEDPELDRDYIRIPFSGGPPGYFRAVRRDILITPDTGGGQLGAAAGLRLRSTTLPDAWAPNRAIAFDASWSSSGAPPAAASQVVRVRTRVGEVVAERTEALGYGWYPTGRWRTDEVFRQHVGLPPLAAGDYQIEVGVGAGPPLWTADLRVEAGAPARARTAAAPSSARLLDDARAALGRDDLDALIRDVEKAAALRGRRRADASWRAFSHELRRRGRQATSRHETTRSYKLLRAASAADPQDVWAQRDLEKARKVAF